MTESSYLHVLTRDVKYDTYFNKSLSVFKKKMFCYCDTTILAMHSLFIEM